MPRSKSGSKREVRPGVWEVSASAGYREDGRQRRAYRTVHGTEADADRALRALVVEMGQTPSLGCTSTVGDYWPMFVRRARAKGLSNATLTDYEKQWRLRIEPAFGDVRWADLRFRDVQQWVYTMGPSAARHAVRVLRRIMNCAVADEVADRSVLDHRRIDYPVARVDPLADAPVIWGPAQVAEAMGRLGGHRIEALFLALVGGGLRVEEGLALTWGDLSATEVKMLDGTDGLMVHVAVTKAWTQADGLHGTKNAFSRRLVPVAEPFSSRLMALAGEPGERLWTLYPGRARREWRGLFADGGPLAGMPYSRMKDMRSVHETIMQDAGALDTVNARLHGRSNVTTGYRHYLKPSDALDAAAERMGERVRLAR